LQGEIKQEEVQLAQFMESKKDDPKVILDFTTFIEGSIEKNILGKSISKQWKSVMSEYRQRIFALTSKSLSEEDWHRLGTALEELSERGFLDVQGATGKCYFHANNLKKAINIWEASGSTTHKEYYRAKAMTLSYPSNLEWWEKAGDQEKIYQEWQNQGGLGKQLEPREVRYIAPLLEERQRYWDACQIYMRVSDPDVKKIANLINKIKKFTPKMVSNREEVNVLINYLCAHDQWKTMLILLEKIFDPIKEAQEQLEIRCTVIRNLAKASLSDELAESETVRKIYHAIIRPARTDRHWQKHLSIETEFGPAVEILGFDMSLRFYEDFINLDMNPELRDFARSRWIANAEMKVEYFKQKGEDIRDRNFLKDYGQRKRDWKISQPTTQTPPVTPSDERKRTKDEVIKAFSPVRGLPSEVKVSETGEGQIKFRIGDIEYTVHKAKKIVMLEDREFNRVRCDLATQQVRSGEIDVNSLSTPEGKIFSIPVWKMAGNMQNSNDQVVLELAPSELTAPFTVEL